MGNKKIISLWNYKIWKKYLETIIFRKGKGVLILDRTSSHLAEFLNELKNTNQKIFYIPSGTTRLLQLLDVSLNKPFKTVIKKYIYLILYRKEHNFCKNFKKRYCGMDTRYLV